MDDIEPWGPCCHLVYGDQQIYHQCYDPVDWEDPHVKEQVAEQDREMKKLLKGSTLIYTSDEHLILRRRKNPEEPSFL